MNKKELFTKIAQVAILNESRFTRQDLKDIVRIFQNNRTVTDPEDPLFVQEELEKLIEYASSNTPVATLSGAYVSGSVGLEGRKILQDYYWPPAHRPTPIIKNDTLAFINNAVSDNKQDKLIGTTNVSYLQPDCVTVSEFVSVELSLNPWLVSPSNRRYYSFQ